MEVLDMQCILGEADAACDVEGARPDIEIGQVRDHILQRIARRGEHDRRACNTRCETYVCLAADRRRAERARDVIEADAASPNEQMARYVEFVGWDVRRIGERVGNERQPFTARLHQEIAADSSLGESQGALSIDGQFAKRRRQWTGGANRTINVFDGTGGREAFGRDRAEIELPGLRGCAGVEHLDIDLAGRPQVGIAATDLSLCRDSSQRGFEAELEELALIAVDAQARLECKRAARRPGQPGNTSKSRQVRTPERQLCGAVID